jgi:hypothetical protein
MDYLMAPFGKDHCLVFKIIALASLFIGVVGTVHRIVYQKKSPMPAWMNWMFILFSAAFSLYSYYINRVFHSMCIKSL